ncbi:DsbA family protein [Pseudoalteromonas sp. MMG010]|uniref:DsbA family protein n=1 Tax=Pseudoalteromonas sp. MMG010 TaxID=2822685 RepID=UPI001B39D84C|nr:DsbA family protein [Pseudoalteromonas sp. MMG010]MBQ4833369.1 DsbA family protein [Pseudoalteromonas sp. MMG010]
MKLLYVHDPMCSWCWGYAPTWDKLKQSLNGIIDIEYRVGGLASDSDEPMPEQMQLMLQSTWQRIADYLGTEFNFKFWQNCQPRRSTYPACRAALLARKENKEVQMIAAIQQAYYLQAKNPSDVSVLAQLAQELGLGTQAEIESKLLSDELNRELMQELSMLQALPVQGFPSLILLHNERAIPIAINYEDPLITAEQIKQLLANG